MEEFENIELMKEGYGNFIKQAGWTNSDGEKISQNFIVNMK